MTSQPASADASPPSQTVRGLLVALLLVAFAARAYLSWSEVGIYWPDEIYQSLEPAHRLAFGYGLRAWEYVDGARNWTFPALVAVVMKVASVFGASSPERYLWLLRMLFSAFGVVAAWGSYRLAIAYKAAPRLALAGAALFAFNAASLYFSHRAMSEVASLPLLVWGYVFLLEDRLEDRLTRPRLWWAMGASLLGLAVLVRLQNGLFCLGALGILFGRRKWEQGLFTFAVLCCWAFAFGLIDKLTWGGWFHSAFKYLQFNVVEGKAAGWGTAPFSYYARVAWTAVQGPALVLLLTLPFAIRRSLGLTLTCIAFVVALGLTPHKEFRFVVPALPLLFALSAVGVDVLADRLSASALKGVLAVGLVVLALHSASRATSLTFGQIGAYEDQKPQASAWGDAASVNRLLLAAHRQSDLCGLKVEAVHMAWAGGQSYFHRPVNLYAHNGAPRQFGFYNYVITAPQWAADARVVATDGALVLAKLPFDTCREDPRYSDRLP